MTPVDLVLLGGAIISLAIAVGIAIVVVAAAIGVARRHLRRPDEITVVSADGLADGDCVDVAGEVRTVRRPRR